MAQYETNKEIPSLSEVRRKQKEAEEAIKDAEALEMLEKAVKFYNKNYPKSEYKNTWNEAKTKLKITPGLNINEFLDTLNENELLLVKRILLYAHDERLITTPKDHIPMNRINAKMQKLIPGASYVDKIIKLKKEKETVDKELAELEEKLEADRKKFNEKFGIKDQFICPYCEKILRSSGGYDYHIVHCKEKPEGE